ncbi:hypothetical protein MHBO_001088 [Bonamia ostreae]|uniref:Uncharacterized protein n=1 Tax=Bonamia ostreae TaxID=126728 RepID=A0ABV2AHT9_9EUKA
MFDLVMKLAMCFMGFTSIFIIVVGSVVAATTDKIVRLIVMNLSLISFFGLTNLMVLPNLILTMFSLIPLVKVEMEYFEGYQYAITAYVVCIMASTVLLVDFIAPPLAPEITDEYMEEAEV